MNPASHSLSGIVKGVALLSLVAIAAGCATKPEIRENHDPTADFRSYKTFAFYDDAGGRAPFRAVQAAPTHRATQ